MYKEAMRAVPSLEVSQPNGQGTCETGACGPGSEWTALLCLPAAAQVPTMLVCIFFLNLYLQLK